MLRRRRARRLGREPRPPRRPRRHGAGLDAAGGGRHPAGGPAHPARPAHSGTSPRSSSRARARPTSDAATSTRSAARTGSASPASPSSSTQLASTEPLAEVVDYGERRMRAALAALPDGQFRFEDVLDSAGPRPEQQSPTPVVVTLTVDGEHATFDFTGTGAQRPGNVNAVEAVTVSAVAFALRSATDPSIPANGGAMRPVDGDRAGGQRRRRAPAGRGRRRQRRGEPAGRRRVPRRPRARRPRPPRRGGTGDDEQRARRGRRVGLLRDRGRRAGWPSREGRDEWRPHRDDEHARHARRSARAGAPDPGAPLRRCGSGSGGAGAYPGGDGIERELELLEPATVSLVTERRVSRPWGVDGGEPGSPGENWLLPEGDAQRARRLPDKCTVELAAGDVIRLLTPGGGGYGDS